MAKISVRHGIARAYGFLFGRLFQIIGLSWLPALLYAVAATYLIERMSGAMQTAVPSQSGLLGEYAFGYFFALVVVTAFLGAVVAVPLTREAMGRHDEAVAAYFVVGAREARLFFAYLRFYAIETVLLVALLIAVGVGVTSAARYATANHLHFDWAGVPFQIWLNVGAAGIGSIVFLLLATKLGFLLTPVATLERHAKLGRAARLSRGNFGRLAFVYVAAGLPATLVLVAFETSFGGLEMGKTLPKGMQAFYTVAPDHIAVFAAILAVGLVVLHALFAGAAAAAYEELEDGVAYDQAPAPEYAAAMAAPAAAYADMRGHDAGVRPGDQRASAMNEHFASQAASEFSNPVQPTVAEAAPHVEEVVMAVEQATAAEAHTLHETTLEAAAPHDAAAYVEATPVSQMADDAVHAATPTDYAEPIPAVLAAAEANGSGDVHAAETHAATDGQSIVETHEAAELPPLDPASMTTQQHADTRA